MLAMPSPLESSSIALKLPPAATTDEKVHALRASANQLALLGTWHCHRGGSRNPSDQDLLQMACDTIIAQGRVAPHVVLIFGKAKFRALFGVSPLWLK